MVVSALVILVAAQFRSSADTRRTFAAGEKTAVMMLPPETVSGSETAEMAWTGDGSSLIVLRGAADLRPEDLVLLASGPRPTPDVLARMRPRTELVAWSVATRKARTLLTLDALRTSISELTPMAASDRVVFQTYGTAPGPNGVTETMESISMVAAGSGQVTSLNVSTGGKPVGFQLSPTKPLGYLFELDQKLKRTAYRFFGATGRLSPTLTYPQGTEIAFDRNGMPGLLVRGAKTGGKPTWSLRRIDPVTAVEGATVPFVVEKDAKPLPDAADVLVVSGLAEGAAAPSLFLRVEGGKPGETGVITTDGERGKISPKGDAVAYVSQGSAVVRLLARVPRKAFDDARLAAQKTAAINNAKQAAIALLMYAGDMDDNFPAQNDYTKIEPYLKNASIMNAFTYTFGGGDMTKIESPAETEIGFVGGPGGRAVAYADGHVKWIPDNP